MSLNIIILAAGNGKRMHSALPKVMHKVGGKTMLEHVLISAEKLNPKSINVVVNSKIEDIKINFQNYKINWLNQKEQKGTADAVNTALPNLKEDDEVLILYADTPLIDYKLLEISNGGLASSAYKKLRNQSEEEVTHIRTELFKYCSLDTYAMYEIYIKLLSI